MARRSTGSGPPNTSTATQTAVAAATRALAIIETCSRLVPGVVGNEDSVRNDSFYSGLLDHAHYTRPRSFRGLEVPDVLLSGNHAGIDEWRRQQALAATAERRSDLLGDEEGS